MPGLAYIAGLEKSLYLPRRAQPRVRVPRSTVAIAMDMTTIYPFESPGGWHLIGRTPLWMFDQRREQPVFLAPGDSLSFQRIDRKTYDRIAREVEAGTFDWAKLVRSHERRAEGRARRACSTRCRISAASVTWRSACRPRAPWTASRSRLANALCGNPANTAGLEIGVMGPDLLVEADSVRVALVGPLVAVADREPGRAAQADRVRPLASAEARPGAAGRHGRGLEHGLSRRGRRLRPAPLHGQPLDLCPRRRRRLRGPQARGGRLRCRSRATRRRRATRRSSAQPFDYGSGPMRVVWGPQDDYFSDKGRRTFVDVRLSRLQGSRSHGHPLRGADHRAFARAPTSFPTASAPAPSRCPAPACRSCCWATARPSAATRRSRPWPRSICRGWAACCRARSCASRR